MVEHDLFSCLRGTRSRLRRTVGDAAGGMTVDDTDDAGVPDPLVAEGVVERNVAGG
jgi:hypothetical protein